MPPRPSAASLLERVTDALVAELRRRLGGRFSAEELVELYDGGTRLVPAGGDEGRPRGPVGVGGGRGRRRRVRADTCARPPTTPAGAGIAAARR